MNIPYSKHTNKIESCNENYSITNLLYIWTLKFIIKSPTFHFTTDLKNIYKIERCVHYIYTEIIFIA